MYFVQLFKLAKSNLLKEENYFDMLVTMQSDTKLPNKLPESQGCQHSITLAQRTGLRKL